MNDSGVITCEAVNARYNLELIQLAPTATYTPPTYTSTFTDVGATGYVVQPTGTPWTYTGLAGVTDSTAWPFFLPGRPPATPWPLSGQTTPTPQVGFIQGESSKFGVSSISQQVTFNTAGSYTLSVQAIGTPTSIGTDPINILVDGKQVETITPITSWATYTSSDFTVTQGVHTVAFMMEHGVLAEDDVPDQLRDSIPPAGFARDVEQCGHLLHVREHSWPTDSLHADPKSWTWARRHRFSGIRHLVGWIRERFVHTVAATIHR